MDVFNVARQPFPVEFGVWFTVVCWIFSADDRSTSYYVCVKREQDFMMRRSSERFGGVEVIFSTRVDIQCLPTIVGSKV